MNPVPQLLIVDDDPLAIQALNRALRGFGTIYVATGGPAALSLLKTRSVDLALLDAYMPVMDSFAIFRALKQDYPDIRVIFVTASSDTESEIRALDIGAVDFITKPIHPPVVRARVSAHLKLKKQADELQALVKRDPLTGIANRRALEEQANLEWRRALRKRHPLAVLMVDIDHFKAFNDHYGHLEGDSCLRRVAQAIEASIGRAGDLVARFGGEEFVALLPDSSNQQAVIVAEKIRVAVRELAIPHALSPTSDEVTVSIGVAVGVPRFPPSANDAPEPADGLCSGIFEPDSLDSLLARADAALYAAKQAGRDRVMPQHDEPRSQDTSAPPNFTPETPMPSDPASNAPQTPIHTDLRHIIYALSDTLDLVGNEDVLHGKRVAIIAAECGRQAGLDPQEITALFDQGLLRDIGVSSTRVHQQLMSQFEWADAQVHCARGATLLGAFRPLAGLAEPIRLHHTRWERLITADIPARVKAQANLIYLADRVNALIAPYCGDRTALLRHTHRVRQEIAMRAHVYFAPQLVEQFIAASASEAFWLNLEPQSVHLYLGNQLRESAPLLTPMRELKHLARLFSRIVDAKSPYMANHSLGVAQVASYLARKLGLSAESLDKIEIAGLVHDLGKLRIPDEIIEKPGPLDDFERHIINTHSHETFQILRRVPGFEEIRWWVAYDLKEPSGAGNPFLAKGETLSLEARILRVSDIFQAMLQQRHYRKALSADQVMTFLEELVAQGRLDGGVVAAVVADMSGAMTAARTSIN